MILQIALGQQIRVELRGLEPLTPTLPVWCATSCATAPGCAPDWADRGSIVHARGHAIGLANRSARSHESVTSVNRKSDTSDIKRRVGTQNSRKHGRSTILDAGTSQRSREM